MSWKLAGRKIVNYGEFTPVELAKYAWAGEEIEQLVELGDEKTLNQYLELRKKTPRLEVPESYTSMGYDYSGDFVDVGRFLSGEPECMVSYCTHHPVKNLQINILTGRPGGTKEWIVMRYFGLVLDLIDYLEVAGYRCRVSILEQTAVRDKKTVLSSLRIPIKDYSEQLNMSVFAAICLNDSLFTKVYRNKFDEFGNGVSPDFCSDFSLTNQTDEQIILPSLYYKNRYDWDANDFNRMDLNAYIKDCNLEFLLK